MSFLSKLGSIAQQAAPLAQAGALFATGGTAATLSKVGLAGQILGAASGQQRSESGQATAVSIPSRAPAETSTSGSTDAQNLYAQPQRSPFFQPASFQQANMIAPPLPTGTARSQNIVPARGVAGFVTGVVSGAAPMILDMFTGEPKKLVVTRKLKSQVKRSVDLMGVEATAEGMGVDVSVVNYILLKKLRNDGAYVTKAAMRKTSSTLRKMKRMCDMYDDLRPAAKRRAPMRKSSQTITNVR
jgi:hypothetical protein